MVLLKADIDCKQPVTVSITLPAMSSFATLNFQTYINLRIRWHNVKYFSVI